MSGKTPSMDSQWIGAHVGEPCTVQCLDHLLTCGHKVMTLQPEPCAKNCKVRRSEFVNVRSVDNSFVCFSCITEDLARETVKRVASFRTELGIVAKNTGKDLQWINEKIKVLEPTWRDSAIESIKKRSAEGRFCHAFYVDPDYQAIVDAVESDREKASSLP